jgi:hypothetical protein
MATREGRPAQTFQTPLQEHEKPELAGKIPGAAANNRRWHRLATHLNQGCRVEYYVFLGLATVGGTIMVCQFVLTLIGMGDHGADGADAGGHDLHLDGHHGDASDGHADGHDSHAAENHTAAANWLFSVISFRTVVAAFTFFGLGGLACQSAEVSLLPTFVIALGCGAAAMYGVHFLMRSLHRFGADGTIRISGAVGKTGTVYIPIPADKSASGKVQLNVQNRLVEYEAVTDSGEKLPTGARVVVTGVVNSRILVVEREREQVASA